MLSFVLPIISPLIVFDFTRGYSDYYGVPVEMVNLSTSWVIKAIFISLGTITLYIAIIALLSWRYSTNGKWWSRYVVVPLLLTLCFAVFWSICIKLHCVDSWQIVILYFGKLIICLSAISGIIYCLFVFSLRLKVLLKVFPKGNTRTSHTFRNMIPIIILLFIILLSSSMFYNIGKLSANVPTCHILIEYKQDTLLVIARDAQNNYIACSCQINELCASKDSLRNCLLNKNKVDDCLNRSAGILTGDEPDDELFRMVTIHIAANPELSIFSLADIDSIIFKKGILIREPI